MLYLFKDSIYSPVKLDEIKIKPVGKFMNIANTQNPPENYNPRWFIWTIVFLVVTGISLVSYIMLSDNGSSDVPIFVRAPKHTAEESSQ